MSGRKKWEVENLLTEGEKARDRIDARCRSEISRYIDQMEQSDAETLRLCDDGCSLEVTLDKAAEEMFGGEGRQKLDRLRSLQKGLRKAPNNNFASTAQSKLSLLGDRLRHNDSAADKLRDRIRHAGSGYLDKEYAQAGSIFNEYAAIQQAQQNLRMEAGTRAQDAMRERNAAAEKVKSIKALAGQIDEMNRVAKLRRAAAEMRQTLENQFEAIDAGQAEKFFATEYKEIKENTAKAKSMADAVLVGQFQDIYNVSAAFATKLNERVARYEREKSDADAARAEAEQKSSSTYVAPLDFVQNGDDAVSVGLFDYLAKFGHGEFDKAGEEYSGLLQKAGEAYAVEDFVKAAELFAEAGKFAADCAVKSDAIEEKLIQKAQLAVKIYDIMADEMGYDVNADLANPDDPAGGYRITCRFGGETIDFQNVDITPDGKVIVDLDHEESAAGQCKSNMASIAKKMRDQGVPLMDVKKNGVSLLGSAGGKRSDKIGQTL